MNDRVPFAPDKEETSIPNPLIDPSYKGLSTFMDDINYHSMAESFDISYEDRRDTRIAEQLSYLADWAREQTKSENISEQKLTIKDLAKALGLQSTGPTLIKKLYQYARLDQDRRSIGREMEGFQARPHVQKEQAREYEPRVHAVNKDVIREKVGEQMKDISSMVKSNVKSTITRSINKGINEAIAQIKPK